MATRSYFYYSYICLALIVGFFAQHKAIAQPKNAKPKPPAGSAIAPWRYRPALVFGSETALRQAVFDSASRFVGMVEKTNNNDARWIAIINHANNLPTNANYCASSFYYVHAVNNVSLPVGEGVGFVKSYFSNPKTIIYRRNQRGNQRVGVKPKMMDAVSLFYSHVEGIAQAHFDPETDDRVKCIGFNTTGGKGTKGGCYINTRRTSDIKFIANWIGPYWDKHFKTAKL